MRIYGEVCEETLATAKGMGIDHLSQAIPYVETSCADPETSVTYIQYGLILLILLPFRRLILKPVFWAWDILWTIMLTMTPLRFFFGRKKKEKVGDAAGGKTDETVVR